jgi:hypothetical protein
MSLRMMLADGESAQHASRSRIDRPKRSPKAEDDQS